MHMEINDGGAAEREFESEFEHDSSQSSDNESENDQQTSMDSESKDEEEADPESQDEVPVLEQRIKKAVKRRADSPSTSHEEQPGQRQSVEDQLDNMSSTLEVMKEYIMQQMSADKKKAEQREVQQK